MNRHKRRSPVGVVLIVIGVLALTGAVAWLVRNVAEDIAADRFSRQTVEKIQHMMETTPTDAAGKADGDRKTTSGEAAETVALDPRLIEMRTYVIEGVPYIGTLEIPSAALVLPVCSEWSYDNLSDSPCRYCGSYLTNDMVICAHDFGSHFRAIRSLDIGDTVYFTPVDGKKIKYLVSNVETVAPTDVDKMVVNTKPDGTGHLWDMTLFTCNFGGQTRCAVRLEKAQ